MSVSKRGRKQESTANEDLDFEAYGTLMFIKSSQAEFQQDLTALKRKLDSSTESLNLKFKTLNGELHDYMIKIDLLEGD